MANSTAKRSNPDAARPKIKEDEPSDSGYSSDSFRTSRNGGQFPDAVYLRWAIKTETRPSNLRPLLPKWTAEHSAIFRLLSIRQGRSPITEYSEAFHALITNLLITRAHGLNGDLAGINKERFDLWLRSLQDVQIDLESSTRGQNLGLKQVQKGIGQRRFPSEHVRSRSRYWDPHSPLSRAVRKIEQVMNPSRQAQQETKLLLESRELLVENNYREKLALLENDYQSAIYYAQRTECLLTRIKGDLVKHKTENEHIKSDLDTVRKFQDLVDKVGFGWLTELVETSWATREVLSPHGYPMHLSIAALYEHVLGEVLPLESLEWGTPGSRRPGFVEDDEDLLPNWPKNMTQDHGANNLSVEIPPRTSYIPSDTSSVQSQQEFNPFIKVVLRKPGLDIDDYSRRLSSMNPDTRGREIAPLAPSESSETLHESLSQNNEWDTNPSSDIIKIDKSVEDIESFGVTPLDPAVHDTQDSSALRLLDSAQDPHLTSPERKCVRLEWHCHCGVRLYDDFVELRPGAAKEYAAECLQNVAIHPRSGTEGATHANTSRARSALGYCLNLMGGSVKSNGPLLPQNSVQSQEQILFQTTLSASSDPRHTFLEELFLLLCIPQHSHAIKLLQPDLTGCSSDRAFFSLLKRTFAQTRGKLKRFLSLKTIRGIKFVQLEVFKSELVNIQKQDVFPPEERKDEYRYSPMPADLIPPVGEHLMLHLLTSPQCAEESDILLARIPKKLKERLRTCPTTGTGLGWGIQFVEGWHFSILIVLAFAILLLASLVFLVCWTVLKHDAQSASGVAAYIVAVIVLGIGSLQAAFGI